MKRLLKMILVLFVVSLITHDVVPHSHHSIFSFCLELGDNQQNSLACKHSNDPLKTHTSSCEMVYISSPTNQNNIIDFQDFIANDFSLVLLWISLFICCCGLYEILIKSYFRYYLNYKSPFVGTVRALRAPPVFNI